MKGLSGEKYIRGLTTSIVLPIHLVPTRHRHIFVKIIVATKWQWDHFCCDNTTMSQQLSWSWKWLTWLFLLPNFIAFLSDNFPQNLEFCPYQIHTSKIKVQYLKYTQFGDKFPHIWSYCSWQCLQYWRNYVINITKTLKTSKISKIIYWHHCCHCHHHIVATILSWPSMLLLRQCCDNPMSSTYLYIDIFIYVPLQLPVALLKSVPHDEIQDDDFLLDRWPTGQTNIIQTLLLLDAWF